MPPGIREWHPARRAGAGPSAADRCRCASPTRERCQPEYLSGLAAIPRSTRRPALSSRGNRWRLTLRSFSWLVLAICCSVGAALLAILLEAPSTDGLGGEDRPNPDGECPLAVGGESHGDGQREHAGDSEQGGIVDPGRRIGRSEAEQVAALDVPAHRQERQDGPDLDHRVDSEARSECAITRDQPRRERRYDDQQQPEHVHRDDAAIEPDYIAVQPVVVPPVIGDDGEADQECEVRGPIGPYGLEDRR